MDFEKEHIRNISRYERQIRAIYDEAVQQAALIGVSVPNFNPNKPFYFADYPAVRQRIDKALSKLNSNIYTVIVNGIDAEWTLANNKNSELAKMVFGDKLNKIPKPLERKYFSNNYSAKEQFLNRKRNGLGISDRVWKYTEQYKEEIEMGIDLGLRNGLPATEMSRDLKQYLRQPEKLFRRVRDQHGNLHLSKRAKAYNPGRGVYRSSYKNALRLATTETNLAYRKADYERRMQADYIVGIEVKLSNNHTLNGVPFTDICDELKGKYPKDFVFTGWHPFCRCHTITILKTWEEMEADNELIMQGKEPSSGSQNQVKETPANFNNWIQENKQRIINAKELPYFISDNKQVVTDILSKPLVQSGTNQITNAPFVMDSSTFNYLNNEGFYLSDKNVDSFINKYNSSQMSGFDIRTFHDELKSILTKYKIELTNKQFVYGFNNRVTFTYYGKFKDHQFKLERTFRFENGVKAVHHDYFVVPEKLQGGGISKAVFRSLYKQYQNAKIQKIDVYANLDVGGRTWGRYGFSTSRNEIEGIIKVRFSNLSITKEQYEDALNTVTRYFKVNKDAKLFPMNLLAEKKYSKNLLLKTNWEGYMDLNDLNQKKIFEDYLFSESKKKGKK